MNSSIISFPIPKYLWNVRFAQDAGKQSCEKSKRRADTGQEAGAAQSGNKPNRERVRYIKRILQGKKKHVYV